jgi:hypothetical protein
VWKFYNVYVIIQLTPLGAVKFCRSAGIKKIFGGNKK